MTLNLTFSLFSTQRTTAVDKFAGERRMSGKFPKHEKHIVDEDNEDDDDEIDLVDEAIKKSGCVNENNAIQECFYEHKDWRKCTKEVKAMKECWSKNNTKKQ